jgi:L-ascorbate metabolism protein UlaG (beta-lactamase superfamily)
MELGFETVGNATLLVHDRMPLLVTDPWLQGSPYFGSWGMSHEIPPEQLAGIEAAEYVWISHGHPDHLSFDSLELFRRKKVLLADHVGGRIADALRSLGCAVTVLPERTWVPLTDRVRIQTISDYNQDSVLLVDIGGRLVVNLNDAWGHGWLRHVRDVVAGYDINFLLRISGAGDGDMSNFFDEEGRPAQPPAESFGATGEGISRRMKALGSRYFIPFSSMHVYQRSDSVWANRYHRDLSDYGNGFDRTAGELLPAFVRYDCLTDDLTELSPAALKTTVRPPEEFGDHWSEPLTTEDVASLRRYFQSIEHVAEHLSFIRFRVGGVDHVIDLGPRRLDAGITFEAPRASLMHSVKNEIFDDLLIANFMKTTLHGKAALYPHFTPYVSKYADNGRARTRAELKRYFATYRKRSPYDYLRHRIELRARYAVRPVLQPGTPAHELARTVYRRLRRT